MNRFISGAILALGLLGVGAPVLADEQEVKEADVPKPAIEAVRKKYPNAKMTEFAKETEDGKLMYEVTIKDGTRKIDINLSPEGKILVEEEIIPVEAVPKEVKKGLADSKYGKWTIKKSERIVKEEKTDDPSFEFYLVDGEKRAEAVFDKSGKLVKEEDKTPKGKPGDKKDDDDDDDDDDDEDDDD